MAVLRLFAEGPMPRILRGERMPTADAFRVEDAVAAAPGLGADAPIIILTHGFMFDPFGGPHCDPHKFLYHFDADRAAQDRWQRSVSWPLGLGFSHENEAGAEGLCVAFSWSARASLREAWLRQRRARFALAYDEAGMAGEALAETIRVLADAFPGRRIDLVGHSLGARVVLAAIASLARSGDEARRAVGRAILLNPAEFVGSAIETLALAGEAMPQVYAVGARENSIFNMLLERFASKVPHERVGLGREGLGRAHPRWIDLQLDRADLGAWLAARGIRIDSTPRKACHWGVYNRENVMALYRAILRERVAWSLEALRAAHLPEGYAPKDVQRRMSLNTSEAVHPASRAISTAARP